MLSQSRGRRSGALISSIVLWGASFVLLLGTAGSSKFADFSRLLLPGAVILALLAMWMLVLALSAARVDRRNAELEGSDELVRVVSVSRTGALVQALRTWSRGEAPAQDFEMPYRIPQYFSLSIESAGMGIWDATTRHPRRVGFLPWRFVREIKSAGIRDGLAVFPGMQVSVSIVADGGPPTSAVTLPFILRGGPAHIGSASHGEVEEFITTASAMRAANLRNGT